MPSVSRQARSVGVDRLQPGDHALLTYSDDDERWEILSMFTRQGFARDEKVFILIDADKSPEEIAPRPARDVQQA
jgi:DcmR-like sensory protein